MMNKSGKQSTLFQSWGVQNEGRGAQSTRSEITHTIPSEPRPGASWQTEKTIGNGWLDDDDDDTPDDIFLNMSLPTEDATSLHAGDATTAPGFDREAGRLWIYPTNYPVREYQWSIIEQALFHNTLVVLPTGLGKTFIAAVLMYNYYRWFPQAKIVFMAPTKPLVAQQIDACYKIMGIPTDDTAEMTGAMPPSKRREAWRKCRVFYLTPQVLMNDMSRGACLAASLRCLVVDEAHKATGNYAYCQVVRELAKHKANFRILALSATPGSDIKCVQEVVSNMLISHIELRTEQSADIKPYSHERSIEKVVVELGEEMKAVKKIYLQIVSKVVDRLKHARVIYRRDVESLSKFMILKSRDEFRQNPPHNMQRSSYGSIEGDFALCISLYHGLQLLQLHGLRSIHSYLSGLLSTQHTGSYARTQLKGSMEFMEMMGMLRDRFQPIRPAVPRTQCAPSQQQPNDASSFGHPKLEKLQEIVLDHFNTYQSGESDGPSSTRIMIFSQYRDSVSEIAEMLNHHRPTVRVISFIGQSSANKNARGFTQKEQLRVMREFRSGNYNTLVSTCVGEEGLDIGDVDLIVCFDAHKSPIRLVQRIGRTGRKRKGRIVMLLTKGKEEQIYNQSQYNKRSIDRAIGNGTKSLVMYACDQRMIPADLHPKCHKMHIAVAEKKAIAKPGKGENPGGKVVRKKKTALTVADKVSLLNGFLTASDAQIWRDRYHVDESILPKLQTAQMLSLTSQKKAAVEQNKTLCQRPTFDLDSSFQDKLNETHVVDHSTQSRHLVDLVQFMQFQSATGEAGIAAYEEEMQSYLNPADVRSKQTGMKKYLVTGDDQQITSRKRSRPVETTGTIDLTEEIASSPARKVRRSDKLPGFSSDEADNSDDDYQLPDWMKSTKTVTKPTSHRVLHTDCQPSTSTAADCVSAVICDDAEKSMSADDCAVNDLQMTVEVDHIAAGETTDMEMKDDKDASICDDDDMAHLFPDSEPKLVFSPGCNRSRSDQFRSSDGTQVHRVATPPTEDEVTRLSSAFTSERISSNDILTLIDVWEEERVRSGSKYVEPYVKDRSLNGKVSRHKVSVAKVDRGDSKKMSRECEMSESGEKEQAVLKLADDVFAGTCLKQPTLHTCGKSGRDAHESVLVQEIAGEETLSNMKNIKEKYVEPKEDAGSSAIHHDAVSHLCDAGKELHTDDTITDNRPIPNVVAAAPSVAMEDGDDCEKAEFDLGDFQDSLWLDDDAVEGMSYQSAIHVETPQPVCTSTKPARTSVLNIAVAAAAESTLDSSVFSFSQALACVHPESQAMESSPVCSRVGDGARAQRTSTPMQRPEKCHDPEVSIRRRLHADFPSRSPEHSAVKCLPVSPTFHCCNGLNNSNVRGGTDGCQSPTFPNSGLKTTARTRDISAPLFDDSVAPNDKPNFSLGIEVGEEPDFDLGFDMQDSDDNLWSDVEMGDVIERLTGGTTIPPPHDAEEIKGIPDIPAQCSGAIPPENSIQVVYTNKSIHHMDVPESDVSVHSDRMNRSKLSATSNRDNLSLKVYEPAARRPLVLNGKKCVGWSEAVPTGRSSVEGSSSGWLCTDSKRSAVYGNKASVSFARPEPPAQEEDDFQDTKASRLTRHVRRHKVRRSPQTAKTKLSRKRKTRLNEFIDAEAELSGSSHSSDDDDDGSDLDTMDASFVNNATQLTQHDVDMRTVYLQSIRSPPCKPTHTRRKPRFKPTLCNEGDIFSQVPREDVSNYLEDSFCVADDEVEEERESSGSDDASSSDEEEDIHTVNGGPHNQRCVTTIASNITAVVDESVIGMKRRHAKRLVSSSDSDTDTRTDGRGGDVAPSSGSQGSVGINAANHSVRGPTNSDHSTIHRMQASTQESIPRPVIASKMKQVIFVNSRELSSAQDVLSALRLQHDMLPMVRQLSGSADYIVSTRLAVNRLLQSELANRSKKTKLVSSIQQLCDTYDRPCVIVETDKAGKLGAVVNNRPLLKSHLVEKLLSSLVQTNVKMVFSDSQDETASLLAELGKQEARKQTTVSLCSEDISSSQQHMLNFYLSLPKVNCAMAFRALAAYQSISQFLYSSAETIMDRCKMSADQVKRIHRYLRHSFDRQMTPLRPKQKPIRK